MVVRKYTVWKKYTQIDRVERSWKSCTSHWPKYPFNLVKIYSLQVVCYCGIFWSYSLTIFDPHQNLLLNILWFYLLTFLRQCFFSGSFLLFIFHVCLYYTVLSVPCCLVITCWQRDELLPLLYVTFPCILSCAHIVSQVRCGIDCWSLYSSLLLLTRLIIFSLSKITTNGG